MLAIDGGKPQREIMLPFGAPWFGQAEFDEVLDTLQSGWITTGPKTKRFEAEFANYVGAKHAVAVNSCTAGLHLSLVVSGIGPGDEVIVPTLTFGATANVVEHVGARPVLVDIDAQTLTMDPAAVERAITPRTKAIIPVHYAGMPCDLDALRALAEPRGIVIIEDAAHAVGAIYNGRMVGSISPLTNFSFYANKNLSTAEGGMVTTDDDALEEKLRVYHLHGLSRDAWKRYHTKVYMLSEVVVPGFKYNMTDLQASLGIHQLRKQEAFIARREEIAAFYDDAFSDMDGLVWTPPRPHDVGSQGAPMNRHVLHLYPLLVDVTQLRVDRNQIITALLAENIGVSMHFNPLHMMPYYRARYGYQPSDFPNAQRVGETEISLPVQPQITDADAHDVVDAVKKVLGAYGR